MRLDIGCGTKEQTYKGCLGIDINPDYQPDFLINVDNEGLKRFKSNSIDFINSDNSLEHFKNAYFVLKEIYRVLRKGGRFRLVVPNAQYFPLVIINLFFDLMKFWDWYMNLPFKKERTEHWQLYTPHLIKKYVRDVGFRIIHAKGFLYSKEIELVLEK